MNSRCRQNIRLITYNVLLTALFIFYFSLLSAQEHKIDSLLALTGSDKDDTNKVNHLNLLCEYYNAVSKTDKAISAGNEAVQLSEKTGFGKGLATAYNAMGTVYFGQKDYHDALASFEKALNACEKMGAEAKERVAAVFDNIGLTYEAQGDNNKAREYYTKATELADETGNKQLQAYTMSNLGNFFTTQGEDSKALEYYMKALKMKEELGDKKGVARGSSNIALEYKGEGDYPKALEYYGNALKMAEESGDKQLQADITSNIGAAYREQGDYSKALEYDFKALRLADELKYKQLQASTASSIGLIYWKRSDYSKALEYYNNALKMAEAAGDKNSAAIITDNLGIVCENQGDFPDALDYEFKALKISKEIGDKAGTEINNESIGEIYLKQKKYKEAEKYILQALYQSDTIHLLEASVESNLNLSELFSQTGQWQKAYEAFKQYVSAKDSLESKDNSKELGKLEAKADYNKQLALQKADADKKAAIEIIETKRQQVIMVLIGVIAFAVIIVALVIFRSLRITRMQKEQIEQQKLQVEDQKVLVESKNKDIVDSITYAKRLQDAILPSVASIKRFFPESFILYRPKEIVAGDFYWLGSPEPHLNPPQQGGLNKNTRTSRDEGGQEGASIFLAAADCTGHGVPGALVSVVCANALNRAVKEFNITVPGRIFDKVRELISETFGKNAYDVKDGMDISLVALTLNPLPWGEGKAPSPVGEGYKMRAEWAGANIPLWYLHKGEILEVTPDLQAIGKDAGARSFTTKKIQLQQGDIIYLLTDGYCNQLAGSNNADKQRKLKEKLLGISFLSMDKQKAELEQMLEESKHGSELADDVLIIAVKL